MRLAVDSNEGANFRTKSFDGWEGFDRSFLKVTLLGTNISPKNGIFEDDVPFPQLRYVNSLEGLHSGIN